MDAPPQPQDGHGADPLAWCRRELVPALVDQVDLGRLLDGAGDHAAMVALSAALEDELAATVGDQYARSGHRWFHLVAVAEVVRRVVVAGREPGARSARAVRDVVMAVPPASLAGSEVELVCQLVRRGLEVPAALLVAGVATGDDR